MPMVINTGEDNDSRGGGDSGRDFVLPAGWVSGSGCGRLTILSPDQKGSKMAVVEVTEWYLFLGVAQGSAFLMATVDI